MDASGGVKSLQVRETVGGSGPLEHAATAVDASDAQDKRLEARCRALPTTRSFFSADEDAATGAVVVWLVHNALSHGDGSHFQCGHSGPFPPDCTSKGALQDLATQVDINKMGSVISGNERVGKAMGISQGCYTINLEVGWMSENALSACVKPTASTSVFVGSEELSLSSATFKRVAVHRD